MKKIALLSLAATTVLMAGGYKIPESSLNAVALSAANVAHAHGADAAYYNPANMIWAEDISTMEAGLTYIELSEIKYDGLYAPTVPVDVSIKSKSEDFLVPNIHYVSPKLGNARVGLSIVSPVGLSKRWDEQPGKSYSEEFTLVTIEVNPSMAIAVNDKVAVAFGIRFVHSEGIVKAAGLHPDLGQYSQDMEGDGFDVGYNLALSYRPTEVLSLAATYRSNIDLNVEGDADLSATGNGTTVPPLAADNYDVAVSVPVPAILSLAAAYTFETDTTVEFVYEYAWWSAYSNLDFEYTHPQAEGYFGGVRPKDWKNTTSYRIGVTQEYEKWTAMAGLVIDETPIPDETVEYSLPGADSVAYSLGGRYQVNEQWNVGLAGLYSIKDDRKVSNAVVEGEFTDSNVYMISAAVEYKF